MSENKFPTEVIDLPSHGWYYDKDSLLASGQNELKYLTAKEEDILTSTNLIQKGLVIEKLLQSLIVNKEISYGDLLIGDKNAIMIASRILGYGKDYVARITCTTCGTAEDVHVDLTELEDREIEEPKVKNENSFEYTLPSSNKKLRFRLLTQADEDLVDEEVIKYRKVDPDIDATLTTRLKHIITAVDGNEDESTVRQFVDNDFLARDSRAFRQHYQMVSPDIELLIDHRCDKCDDERRVRMPIGIDFFWPDTAI